MVPAHGTGPSTMPGETYFRFHRWHRSPMKAAGSTPTPGIRSASSATTSARSLRSGPRHHRRAGRALRAACAIARTTFQIDREAQKDTAAFTGVKGLAEQDAMIQQSQGYIADRTRENLRRDRRRDRALSARRHAGRARRWPRAQEPRAPWVHEYYRTRPGSWFAAEGVPLDAVLTRALSAIRWAACNQRNRDVARPSKCRLVWRGTETGSDPFVQDNDHAVAALTFVKRDSFGALHKMQLKGSDPFFECFGPGVCSINEETIPMTADANFDPVTLEILWSRLISIADESAAALLRTSFSTIVRESNDFATVSDGRQRRLPGREHRWHSHRSTAFLPRTVKHFLARFPRPDLDAPAIVSSPMIPWLATGHLPDITMVMPIFHDRSAGCLLRIHRPFARHWRLAVVRRLPRAVRRGAAHPADEVPARGRGQRRLCTR